MSFLLANWQEILYSNVFDFFLGLAVRLRALFIGFFRRTYFYKLGRLVKLRDARNVLVVQRASVGDCWWIEAISQFTGVDYSPKLEFGDGVSLGDLTHISCVSYIHIGENNLIGGKVYIGVHSHGSLLDLNKIFSIPPTKRPLDDVAKINIESNSWIYDSSVILAGTRLAPYNVVAVNSVVRLRPDRPALVAEALTKVIRYFD